MFHNLIWDKFYQFLIVRYMTISKITTDLKKSLCNAKQNPVELVILLQV